MSGIEKRKVLVTGATGFLGKHLCTHLQNRGFSVRGFGRNEAALKALQSGGIEPWSGSLENPAHLEAALKGVRAVVHAGALSTPWGTWERFKKINVEATENLAEQSLNGGVERFIYISSPSIYFSFQNRLGIREDDPLPAKPVNNYALSKILGERAVNSRAARGLSSVILRPQAIFGEGDVSLLPRILATARITGIPEFVPGGPLLDLTYVENVCHAVSLALEKVDATGAFNVTNGVPVRLLPFLEDLFCRISEPWRTVRRPLGPALALAGAMEFLHKTWMPEREPLFTRYAVGVLAWSRTLDITRAKELLGYNPVVPLNEGVERFVKSIKQ